MRSIFSKALGFKKNVAKERRPITPPLKIAVLTAPPLGHISRIESLLDALSTHLDFQATVFIPRRPNIKQIQVDKYDVVDIAVTSNDWLLQSIVFADLLRPHDLKNNYDLILYDTNPLQWLSAMDLSQMRTVCLTNIFLTQHAREPILQIDRHNVDKAFYDSLREKLELPPFDSAYDLYEADLVLLADPPIVIDHYGPLPDHYKAFGAAYWSSPGSIPPEIKDLDDILLICLGSTGSKKALTSDLVNKLKLHTGSKHVVMTGMPPGPAYADFTFERLPINDILPQCRAVITQGGSGASYQALAQNVPVIAAPHHKNHKVLGEVLQKLGVGTIIDRNAPDKIPARTEFDAMKARLDLKPKSSNANAVFDAMAQALCEFCKS